MGYFQAIYDSGLDLAAWDEANEPDEELLWRKGMSQQIRKIGGVAALLPNTPTPKVVGRHTSKSVRLPVTCFRFSPYEQVEAYAFIRDNFHDIKVVVVSDSPIHMPYHMVHTEWSLERYEKEIERFRGYHKDEAPELAQKRRAQMATDDWYKEWSNGSILRKDGRIYCAGSHQEVYCEGINRLGLPDDVFKPYEDGSQGFVCEVGSYATVAMILEWVISSLEQERYKRNAAARKPQDAFRE